MVLRYHFPGVPVYYVYKGDAMIHTDQPTTEAWVLPGGAVLLTAVHEAGETCVTLAVNVAGRIEEPGAALVEVVHALALARTHLLAVADEGGVP